MRETLELLKDDSNYYGELGRTYLSNSDVKVLLSNPALFKQDTPDNLAFAKGRYFHQLILEPSKAEDTTFVDCNTRTTKITLVVYGKRYITGNNELRHCD